MVCLVLCLGILYVYQVCRNSLDEYPFDQSPMVFELEEDEAIKWRFVRRNMWACTCFFFFLKWVAPVYKLNH